MKCFQHQNTDAIGTCVHCGRALCPACIVQTASNRIVCSGACGQAVSEMEAAFESVRNKTAKSNRYAGYFLMAAGLAMALFDIMAVNLGRTSGHWLLAAFVTPMAIIFIICGVALLRLTKKAAQTPPV
jgi:hypothetical protein